MCSSSDALLLSAVRHAPRRHRLPSLPADVEAARASGADVAIAFALEALRRMQDHGAALPVGTEALFSASLDALIRTGLAPEGGDALFQALVLEEVDATVRGYRRLAASAAADWRAVRATVDAIAHPGKLRDKAGPMTARLAELHRLATDGVAGELRRAAASALADATRTDPTSGAAWAALNSHPALERLERMALLSGATNVRRYLSLLDRRGGDAAAADHEAQGHAARRGRVAEALTIQAFARIAALLNRRAGATERFRATGGLRPPRDLPLAARAKGEWDAVLVREAPHAGAAEIVLLAEVKAAPAAAADDLPSLRRGLHSLARAQTDAVYSFASIDGELRISAPRCAGSDRAAPHCPTGSCTAARRSRRRGRGCCPRPARRVSSRTPRAWPMPAGCSAGSPRDPSTSCWCGGIYRTRARCVTCSNSTRLHAGRARPCCIPTTWRTRSSAPSLPPPGA
jgi:hypothetical protein